jgi:hypothetical protein
MRAIKPVHLLVACTLLLAGAALFVHLTTTAEEYSRHNIGWNGTSTFLAQAEISGARTLTDLAELEGREKSLLIVIAPHRDFSLEDIARYRTFLEQGNTIFLADDFGTGNSLLAGLGSSIRIHPEMIASLDAEYNNPHTVIAYRSPDTSTFSGIESIVLNRPVHAEGPEILMETSVLTWIDGNGNGRADAGEVLGRYPVMVREAVEGGTVVVLSDPSIFINAMQSPTHPRGNTRFISSILTGDDEVLIDQVHSRVSSAGGIIGLITIITNSIELKIIITGIIVLLVAYLFRQRIL